jgi:serine/threonine-protein kinase RsbW
LRLRLASSLQDVALAAAAVRTFALAAGMETSAIDDLELATVEAANNVVLHGYGGASNRRYAILLAAGRDAVRVVISDHGSRIPEAALAQTSVEWNLDDESGRGIAIIRACTDQMEYCHQGRRNRMLLVKRLRAVSPDPTL